MKCMNSGCGCWDNLCPDNCIANNSGGKSSQCDSRTTTETISIPNAELDLVREFFWLNHGHDWLYGDDGQRQCSKCFIERKGLDFKESPITDLIYPVRDHIAALRKQVEELQADRDRLDWLEENPSFSALVGPDIDCGYTLSLGFVKRVMYEAKTIREAIDKARSE